MEKTKAQLIVEKLNRKKRHQRLYLNLFLAIILTVPIVLIYRSCGSISNASSLEGEIIVQCQKSVQAELENPSTAEWPSILTLGEQLHQLNEWKYTFKSYVDCKNDLGVLQRINFTCYLTVKGDKITIDEIKYQ